MLSTFRLGSIISSIVNYCKVAGEQNDGAFSCVVVNHGKKCNCDYDLINILCFAGKYAAVTPNVAKAVRPLSRVLSPTPQQSPWLPDPLYR